MLELELIKAAGSPIENNIYKVKNMPKTFFKLLEEILKSDYYGRIDIHGIGYGGHDCYENHKLRYAGHYYKEHGDFEINECIAYGVNNMVSFDISPKGFSLDQWKYMGHKYKMNKIASASVGVYNQVVWLGPDDNGSNAARLAEILKTKDALLSDTDCKRLVSCVVSNIFDSFAPSNREDGYLYRKITNSKNDFNLVAEGVHYCNVGKMIAENMDLNSVPCCNFNELKELAPRYYKDLLKQAKPVHAAFVEWSNEEYSLSGELLMGVAFGLAKIIK